MRFSSQIAVAVVATGYGGIPRHGPELSTTSGDYRTGGVKIADTVTVDRGTARYCRTGRLRYPAGYAGLGAGTVIQRQIGILHQDTVVKADVDVFVDVQCFVIHRPDRRGRGTVTG